jgi:hypothetical protein
VVVVVVVLVVVVLVVAVLVVAVLVVAVLVVVVLVVVPGGVMLLAMLLPLHLHRGSIHPTLTPGRVSQSLSAATPATVSACSPWRCTPSVAPSRTSPGFECRRCTPCWMRCTACAVWSSHEVECGQARVPFSCEPIATRQPCICPIDWMKGRPSD